MANTSLYDLAVLRRADPYTGLVEDVTTLAPEFSTFGTKTRDGQWYPIVRRTTVPTAQFRKVNAGVSTSKSIYKREIKEMFFVDVILNMDEAVYQADDQSVGSLWQNEVEGAIRASSILIGQQTWYGTSADANGFAGVRSQVAFTTTAGGTTNSTSAYLCWMDEKQGCRYDVGMNGNFGVTGPIRQQILDGSSNPYFAYVGNLSAWVGFNVMSDLSLFAVTGVVASDMTKSLNDNIANQLLAQIPAARRSNLRWFMNRTAQSTLQRSRTTINIGQVATTPTAAYQPSDASGLPGYAPLPTNLIGYPITLSDSILDTESN